MKTTWSFQKVILHIGPTFSMQTNQRQGRGNQMKKKCESVKLGGRVMVQVQSERRVRREASDYEMNRGMYSSSI